MLFEAALEELQCNVLFLYFNKGFELFLFTEKLQRYFDITFLTFLGHERLYGTSDCVHVHFLLGLRLYMQLENIGGRFVSYHP